MIGAIKRRWKSKKAKVLHKGPELALTDSCPATRGFGDEDFEKMIKPPSPRQIHPVLEQTIVTSNSGQPTPHHHHHCGPKSSTLPASGEESPCPFIRVNSGRIELVNFATNKDVRTSPGYNLPHPPTTAEVLSEKLRRRLGGRLRNDSRHSWCGGSRDGKLKGGSSGLLISPPLGPMPGKLPVTTTTTPEVDPTYSDPIEEKEIIRLRTSLLQERLEVLETLAKNSSRTQREEKKDVERCMSDLAGQVSRAVSLQQLMKSEVEKLQDRIGDLERHNRALATMIVPTLMKLQETIGKEGGREKSQSNPRRNETFLEIKAGESWSTGSSGGLKEKKIDCRIPRINYRLSRTKHQQELVTGQESSSPDFSSPRVLPNGGPSPNPCSPRRLSPAAFPKSKSSSANNRTAPTATKSSTFSGIPRMSPSPRSSTPSESGSGKGISSLPSGGVRSGGHKNDSQRIPYTDFHSNGNSRLPVRKTGYYPKSTKTNPGKVNSVIHHTSAALGTHKNLPISATNGGASLATATTVLLPGANQVLKPLGKDEGYSTMSSEALAEQEGSLSKSTMVDNGGLATHLTKSNTFSTFPDTVVSTSTVVTPSPRQLITGMERGKGEERNWTSLPKSTITATTPPPPLSNVRIVRGISSYETQEGSGGGGSIRIGETNEPPSSTSTILWEDSDDSDILFLPLEMSTTSGASSPTLVPPSWNSSRLPSSNSFSTASTASTLGTTPGDGQRRSNDPWPVTVESAQDDNAERALIEKWMRLEDVRNQVQLGDEWAWDWDGVERTCHHHVTTSTPPWPRSVKNDLRLPEFWNLTETIGIEESPTLLRSPSQIDSSTWTKSRKGATGKELRVFPEENDKGSVSQDQEGLVDSGAPVTGDDVNDESPPPAIEFTPAYYQLVKYGSISSVNNDKDQQCIINPSSICKRTKKEEGIKTRAFLDEGKMDDKISQTDFGSSLENLSVSSELFTECRNCLELIKRLVGGIDEASGTSPSGSYQGDTLTRDTLVTDNGSPTTWIPVPKGLPSTEVDRILEILSSSESEDILSPQNPGREKGKNSTDFGAN